MLMAAWILFHFQDSNPFASLVFYWEPLNRQVSDHSQDSWGALGWEGPEFVDEQWWSPGWANILFLKKLSISCCSWSQQ